MVTGIITGVGGEAVLSIWTQEATPAVITSKFRSPAATTRNTDFIGVAASIDL